MYKLIRLKENLVLENSYLYFCELLFSQHTINSMVKNKTMKQKIHQKKKYIDRSEDARRVYSETDYNSNDGMLTTVWGPSTWHFLHTMSFNYPANPTCDDKRRYQNFVMSLQYILPCGKCRKNLLKNFKILPLTTKDMESRHTFSLYMYKLHEVINGMLNKKSGLSYEDVRERYEHFRSRCAKSVKHIKMDLKKRKTMKKSLDKKDTKDKKENGCTEPLYGEKSKCVLQIVPQTTKCDTFQMDEKCKKKILTQ